MANNDGFTHFDKRPTSRTEEDLLRSSALHELRSFHYPVNLSALKVGIDCATFHLGLYLLPPFYPLKFSGICLSG